jgi:hypothetical protein
MRMGHSSSCVLLAITDLMQHMRMRMRMHPLISSQSLPPPSACNNRAAQTCNAFTCLCVLQIIVPDGPLTAWFLKPEERVALHKVVGTLSMLRHILQ